MRMVVSVAALAFMTFVGTSAGAEPMKIAQAAPAPSAPADTSAAPAAPAASAPAPAATAPAPAAPAPAAAAPAPAAPAATTAAAPAAVAPDAGAKLIGLAAWGQLVGNSITGQESGKTLVEFYAPDGTAKSMSGNEISTGKWALAGDTVCFKYEDDDKPECYRVEVAGNTATYYDAKGSGSRYEILKGNPKGL
jgi:hypothetical protein